MFLALRRLNHDPRRILFRCVGLTLLLAAGPANAGMIFDNSSVMSSHQNFGVGNSPGTYISIVTANTTITNISVLNHFATDGHLTFLIFDRATFAAPLYVSASQGFAADSGGGDSWRRSADFSFTLLAGHQYFIGAIADVAGSYAIGGTAYMENGLTSSGLNGNFANFATPTVSFFGSADIALRLEGAAAVATPEPASVTLLGIGAVGMIGYACRRRKPAVA